MRSWLIVAMTAATLLSGRLHATSQHYVSNRPPLVEVPYVQLPLGAIEPRGWLHHQLLLQARGMAGNLDEIYTNVGPRNGWLGGDGDSWERGPYWLDGLVPLAYILKDDALIRKAQKWIEWTLSSRQPDGYFGPKEESASSDEPGVQRGNKGDWWPRMVMLKVLQSYYEATQDPRVLKLMTHYFRYQLKALPARPLAHWTHWGRNRGGENLASIYWLYNRTGEEFLLELAQLVSKQTDDWTNGFLTGKLPSAHGVNVSMGLKQPAVYYQQARDKKYLEAVEKGWADLLKYHGQVQGMFSGDEMLHGTDPTQGTELCTVVELMFSLETLVQITGRLAYADHLERVAFNALPAQIKADYTARQYFQQANQILCSVAPRNFITDHKGTDLCFGLLTGYPCCTTNMHQGWPKYVQNLWLATSDNGLAALIYAPSEVEAKVADGVTVRFIEQTDYPFDDKVKFVLSRAPLSPGGERGATPEAPTKPVRFPLHLRIPGWCETASVSVNGREWLSRARAGDVVRIDREWTSGDTVELHLPMKIRISRWHENSVGIERGPLVYGLRIEEEWRRIGGDDPYAAWEVHPRSPWNYGLIVDERNPDSSFRVVQGKGPPQPWELNSVPIRLIASGKRIPHWQNYGAMAGPLPYSPVPSDQPVEAVTLIPYGATRLRIAQFPVVR